MKITKPITKAVIPAAGSGTRFLPATKACPKEMLPIVDKPTIQYIIEEALSSGCILSTPIPQKERINSLFSAREFSYIKPEHYC